MQAGNATETEQQNHEFIDNVIQDAVKNVTTILSRLEAVSLKMNCSHSIVREMSTPSVAQAQTVWYPQQPNNDMVNSVSHRL